MEKDQQYIYHQDNFKNSEPHFYTTEKVAENEMVINIGPQHPSTHGVLRLSLIHI